MEKDKTRHMVMVGYENAQILDIAGPLEMFAAANVLHERAGKPGPLPYHITLLARETGPFMTTGGLELVAHQSFASFDGPVDTFLVSGGDGTGEAMRDKCLVAFIAETAARAERVVSICSGTFLLAKAGLLDGRRATTHWASLDLLKKHYPSVHVEEDALYVRDGSVWSSAGVTSGMDLALALLVEDLGADIALDVARKNVVFMMRPGGQSQFSTHLKAAAGGDGPVGRAMAHVVDHLQDDLSVEVLADVAGLSERTFLRRFREASDLTPAKFVEAARLEAARQRLEATRSPVEVIAAECGFGSPERMRRTFQRQLGVPPQHYRDRFQIQGSQAELTQEELS